MLNYFYAHHSTHHFLPGLQPGMGAPNPDYDIKNNGWGRSASHGLALPDGVVNSGRFNCTQCKPGKFSGQTWTDKCSDCDKGTHAGWW